MTMTQQRQEQQVQDIAAAMPTGASAAPGGWFYCKVWATGPAIDASVICIGLGEVGGKFSAWYLAHPGMTQEALATALTAVAHGKTVNVALSTTDAYGTIERIYVCA